MSRERKEKVIILRKTKYSEADLILQALTPQGQKLSLIARGALRSKKRFGGGLLEPTHYVEIQYRPSNSDSHLLVLEDAQLINGFDYLRNDYDRLQLALFILECAARVAQEGEVHAESLFNLVGNAFKALEKVKDFDLFKVHFGLRFLHEQGVLETEPWMHDYLRTPLSQTQELHSKPEVLQRSQAQAWVNYQITQYLKTAEGF